MGIAHRPPLGSSFIMFFATGYIGFQFYQAVANYLNTAVKSNKSLLAYPNVAPIDTIFARYILQLATTAVVSISLLLPIVATLKHTIQLNWFPLLEGAIAGSMLALGIAFANNVLFQQFPLYEKLFEIVSRPLLMLSGVFYLPDMLPHPMREIVLLNPITHVIISFRKGFYPEYRASGYDPDYLLMCASISLFLGLCVFTSSRRVLRGR